MKDQVDLLRKNIPAEMINSSLAKKDIDRILTTAYMVNQIIVHHQNVFNLPSL